MVLGSPIIGIYLVAIPFIIIARTIGNFTLWVTELVIRNEVVVGIVRGGLEGALLLTAIVFQFLLVRLSLDLMKDWIG